MQRKYTHIFFDLDNTLWDFKTNSKIAMKSAFSLLDLDQVDVSFEDFYTAYARHNKALWEAYRKNKVKKKELTFQRFQFTFDELNISGIDANKMNELYLHEMPKQNQLVDGTLELLNILKAKNYKLFIITNGFKEVQHKKLQSSELDSYFTKVFISEEIRAPKPSREIFEYALKSANAKKSRSLMIGDDWEVDVLGALRFGMDAVHYQALLQPDSKKYKPLERTPEGAFRVDNLKVIADIL